MARPKKTEPKEETATEVNNSIGPSLFSRDENGLLKNIQYSFNENGSVNWRAMIKDDQLFPNRSWFNGRQKDVPRSAEGLADHQLLIKLGGIKELARLRGFSHVHYRIDKCENDHVAVTCNITFMPNYETGNQEVVFSDMANATAQNTSSFATKFLETIACNRAFVRCVRNFLNVHIVGDDEMDKSNLGPASAASSENGDPFSPVTTLKKKAKETLSCDTFEDFKVHLRTWWQEKRDGVFQNKSLKEWTSWEDISAKDARNLIGLIP